MLVSTAQQPFYPSQHEELCSGDAEIFCRAVLSGDTYLVEKELKLKPDLLRTAKPHNFELDGEIIQTSPKMTVLHAARRKNYPTMLRVLLKYLPRYSHDNQLTPDGRQLLNAKTDTSGHTALFHNEYEPGIRKCKNFLDKAAIDRAARCTALLLEAGININLKSDMGDTAFHQMIAHCDLPGTRLLIEHVKKKATKSTDLIKTELFKFLNQDCLSIVLGYHVPKECDELVNTPDDRGDFPLSIAVNTHIHQCTKVSETVTDLFTELSAELTAKDEDIATSEELIKLLLDNGADPAAPMGWVDHLQYKPVRHIPNFYHIAIFDYIERLRATQVSQMISSKVLLLFNNHRPVTYTLPSSPKVVSPTDSFGIKCCIL